ncbi:N(4)-(beta-N-acetylglucosaminyl)-L-asparaginase [Strongyloides ratti]|uniref:N(4)-(beta-N-acetylglucosaminyl)-L-asparaginase n=1 Tax=Strongyloides ratti TaxID=34506 RepID=A0A090MWM3_STRRB|nr:N(4)-(beta-N-acetylglucosaminyl)-L-asparaginase [Strongyloides ratti]CEF63934.1 N(4)-(beta-N-acetylglucosaminyl)-L-asparaginase [Strongyloides ratti]
MSKLTFFYIFLIYIIQFSVEIEFPIVLTTWAAEPFQEATGRAFDVLKKTNNRLYALTEGLSKCEELQCDGTVGFGGSPDENGETTLDALIMDSFGQRMGAVGDLRRIKDAAKVAWAVMNYTKHSFLVGDHATKFAIQMGFKEESLETDKSINMNKKWRDNKCQPNFWQNVIPSPSKSCGPYSPNKYFIESNKVCENEMYSNQNHDTIGMIIIDNEKNISVGTSTNGARNKIPGRIGDSPIPGAGGYTLNGIGGCSATGDGDIMMRFLPSYHTVENMKNGLKPKAAARLAIQRIQEVYGNFFGALIAANVNGEIGAACSGMKTFSFTIQSGLDKLPRVYTVDCIIKLN